MPPDPPARGKKRTRVASTPSDAEESPLSSSSTHNTPDTGAAPVKKAKRAETRKCPVCEEAIPVRLLARHSVLEMERVEEIMQQIGSTEVLADAEPDEGLTSRSRRSAVKARKSIRRTEASSRSIATTSQVTIEHIEHTLRALKRHRKQRHSKLKEFTREDEGASWWGAEREDEGTLCPVCERMVPGDTDVVEAHVDSCLAHMRMLEEQQSTSRRRDDDDIDIGGDEDIRTGVMEGVSLRGLGFATRDRMQHDIEDEVDIDGMDDVTFGAPQFTEDDLLLPASERRQQEDEDIDVDIDDEDNIPAFDPEAGLTEDKSLRTLVADGKVVRRRVEAIEDVKRTVDEVMGVGEADEVDRAVEAARKTGDQAALIQALQNKVNLMVSMKISSSTSLLCRICLDPYTEPTASTGCWHTCCRECWLRCLGSTKLCPICKRITSAADLRRIYL
ncbi:hypothetical protein CERSUDRAFT_103393 [Gelatoporia subvermispora B]|uniref:RING-type domain-containing protein n=1 Tax=Ceriporiopsis subvermispora (strain B) TaxID=914234 RepID=M2PW73_CERS8|nr:hypothetical protein CERSUDRAFT_103393 [Gelatoporia subvermispora B]